MQLLRQIVMEEWLAFLESVGKESQNSQTVLLEFWTTLEPDIKEAVTREKLETLRNRVSVKSGRLIIPMDYLERHAIALILITVLSTSLRLTGDRDEQTTN